jgi:hypothetical protein
MVCRGEDSKGSFVERAFPLNRLVMLRYRKMIGLGCSPDTIKQSLLQHASTISQGREGEKQRHTAL